jgi:glycosyltransferase involved in cell wall biosynthesis
MKICVITSNTAASEPRAPRHAIAAKLAFPDADVLMIDLLEAGVEPRPDPVILAEHGIRRRTVRFPTRRSDLAGLLARKVRTAASRAFFRASGTLFDAVFGDRCQDFAAILKDYGADLYIAHNIETLHPSVKVAGDHATLVFDCMEFYSDMGDIQSPLLARATKVLEKRYISRCDLVIASSDELADALVQEYGIRRPLAAYNVPPKTEDLAPRLGGGLKLYWRNNMVGFGQRGLEDALVAMTMVPQTVRLSLQGHPAADGGAAIRAEIDRLGIAERVVMLPPFEPEAAVRLASMHDVGLCLERKGPRNHELTVSNKLFDYHMAGLAVITSDLPSLKHVLARSGGGITYKANDPRALAEAILHLNASPELLASLKAKARRFAMDKANFETELASIAVAFKDAVIRRSG